MKNKRIINYNKIDYNKFSESKYVGTKQKGKSFSEMEIGVEKKLYEQECLMDDNIGQKYDDRYILVTENSTGEIATQRLWVRPTIAYDYKEPCPGKPKAMFELMLSLKDALQNVERSFVKNYNKAKVKADLLMYLPGSLGLVFILICLNSSIGFVFVAVWEITYLLILYISPIYFDPRKADTREFDEVGYVIDENDLFNETCLGE